MRLVNVTIHHATETDQAGVAVLTLNDPKRRNVLSLPLVADLVEALDSVESDASVGALIVTGAAPAFCAGADLSNLDEARQPGSGEESRQTAGLRAIYEGFLRVARSPLPTVAAVNGPAVGAGMNLALACDVRVCGISARYDTRFLDLGLHPGGGHTWMLHRIVGPETAAAMVLFGERYDGQAAVAHGLAYSCVADAELPAEALRLGSRAASAPRELAVRVKQTLQLVSCLGTHDEGVEAELQAQVWSLGQPFFAERLAALQARVGGKK